MYIALGTCCPVFKHAHPYPLRRAARAPVLRQNHMHPDPLARAAAPYEPQRRRAPVRPRLRPTARPGAKDLVVDAEEPHPLATSQEAPVDGDAGERAGGARGWGEASAAREGAGRAHWEPAFQPGAAAHELAASPAKVQTATRPKSGGRVEPVAGDGREKNSRPKSRRQAGRSHRERRRQRDAGAAEPTPHGWAPGR